MANKKFWLGMLVLVFGLTLVGCGGIRLNGTWVSGNGGELKFKNGTYEASNGKKGTYTTSGNSVIITFEDIGQPYAYTYSVSGDTLTLFDATWTKKQEGKPKSSGKASALAGRWSLEPGQPTRSNIEDMELLKDGTGIVDGEGVSWKVENSRFYIFHPMLAASWGYKVSGTTLTLTTDDGTNLRYKKK